jgi:RNA polymerase primary sigma factor
MTTDAIVNGIDLRLHLGLIGFVLRKWRHLDAAALEQDDLFNAGFFGLRRAAEKYDHARGCRFSTYAVYWIRQSVQRVVADQSRTVRVPVWLQDRKRRNGERLPPGAVSLDAPLRPGDPDAASWLDILGDDHDPTAGYDVAQRRALVEDAVDQLPSRLRHIVTARFWGGQTLQQVGDGMSLTRERVRQLESEALNLLRENLKEAP